MRNKGGFLFWQPGLLLLSMKSVLPSGFPGEASIFPLTLGFLSRFSSEPEGKGTLVNRLPP